MFGSRRSKNRVFKLKRFYELKTCKMWRLALKQPYVWLQFFVSKLFGCAILFKKGIVLLVSSNFLGVKIEVKTSLKVCRIKQRPVVTQTVTVTKLMVEIARSTLQHCGQSRDYFTRISCSLLYGQTSSLKDTGHYWYCPTSLLT